jgi:hypothetical protein
MCLPILSSALSPYYLIHCTIFEKKKKNRKFVFWFSLQLFFLKRFILGISQSDPYNSCAWVCMWIAQYSCHTLLYFEFSRQVVKKYWNVTLMRIPPVGVEIFLRDRRTVRHSAASCQFKYLNISIQVSAIYWIPDHIMFTVQCCVQSMNKLENLPSQDENF